MKEYNFKNGSKIIMDLRSSGTFEAMGDTIISESNFFDVYKNGKLIAENIETYEEAEELAKQ